MKKVLSVLLLAALSLSVFAGCTSKDATSSAASASSSSSSASSTGALKVIKVGASPTPHAEILAVAKEVLKEQGYDLQVKEFSDYVLPNTALENKELDANYFQHQPYLDDFNKKQGTHIVSAGAIHYEPFGLYAGKTKSLSDIKDGATIAVPNDTTNEARALLLLQDQKLIKLKDNAGIEATQKDIVENKKGLKFKEIEAAQLVRSLQDVDFAIINGNYAIQGGLKVSDALATESKDSVAAKTYANIVAVRKGDENRDDIKALVSALKSDKVKKFIQEKYNGSVVAVD